jgi:hypothetical protein
MFTLDARPGPVQVDLRRLALLVADAQNGWVTNTKAPFAAIERETAPA